MTNRLLIIYFIAGFTLLLGILNITKIQETNKQLEKTQTILNNFNEHAKDIFYEQENRLSIIENPPCKIIGDSPDYNEIYIQCYQTTYIIQAKKLPLSWTPYDKKIKMV